MPAEEFERQLDMSEEEKTERREFFTELFARNGFEGVTRN